MFNKTEPSRSLRMKTLILANTCVDPGQLGQVIPPEWKPLAADKHMIAKLPLVPFVIINLTRLTAGVCMKVRLKSKVTRGFSFSPLRDSCSPLREKKKNQEKSLGPGYSQRWFQSRGLYVSNKCVYSSFTISFTMFHSQDLNKFRPELKLLIYQYLIHSTEIQ